MKEIIQKIYLEKDIATNISLFVSSVVSLIIYLYTDDTIMTFIILIGVFPLTKVLSNIIIHKHKNKLNRNDFSVTEKQVIKEFIKRGGCFITMNEYKENIFNSNGLDSLVSREFIEFQDNGGFGMGPSGFKLDEKIYKVFLKNKSWAFKKAKLIPNFYKNNYRTCLLF